MALTWSRGSDNHSPISKYTIQTKTILSDDWKDAKTGEFMCQLNLLMFPRVFVCLFVFLLIKLFSPSKFS